MATDLEKQAKNLFAALNAHDLEGFLSFHTDDVIVTMADGTVLRGKEEVRDYFKNSFTAISGMKADLTSFFSSGNHQCEEYILSGKAETSWVYRQQVRAFHIGSWR
jgi:ketosteroid isomerase-like protein